MKSIAGTVTGMGWTKARTALIKARAGLTIKRNAETGTSIGLIMARAVATVESTAFCPHVTVFYRGKWV